MACARLSKTRSIPNCFHSSGGAKKLPHSVISTSRYTTANGCDDIPFEGDLMKKSATLTEDLERRQLSPLVTPTDLERAGVRDISAAMNGILADVFALYLKTKNFHWHMSGPHFRDYHLLLDEHGDQLFAMTDQIAERARKLNGTTIRSIGDIERNQRLKDNDELDVTPEAMLAELREDNLH